MTNEEKIICKMYLNDLDKTHSCNEYKLLMEMLEAQPSEDDFVKHKKEVLERIAKREREIDKYIKELETLEQQSCEDCISRQAVLDIINFEDEWLFDSKSHNADTKIAFSAIKYKISELPSVTPERPKGKWMECGGDEPWLKGYCCSLCNFTATNKYNYCPDCGAEMGGGEDEVSD